MIKWWWRLSMANKFTANQKKIRDNYKKKYGKKMPLPEPMIKKWATESKFMKKNKIKHSKDAK